MWAVRSNLAFDFSARNVLTDPTEAERRVARELNIELTEQVRMLVSFLVDMHIFVVDEKYATFYSRIDERLNADLTEWQRKRKRVNTSITSEFGDFTFLLKKNNTKLKPVVVSHEKAAKIVFDVCQSMDFDLAMDTQEIPPFARLMISRVPHLLGYERARRTVFKLAAEVESTVVLHPFYSADAADDARVLPTEEPKTLFYFAMMVCNYCGFDCIMRQQFTLLLFGGELDEGEVADPYVLRMVETTRAFMDRAEEDALYPFPVFLRAARAIQYVVYNQRTSSMGSAVENKSEGMVEMVIKCERSAFCFEVLRRQQPAVSGCSDFLLHNSFTMESTTGGMVITTGRFVLPIVVLNMHLAVLNRTRDVRSYSVPFAYYIAAASEYLLEVDADEEADEEAKNSGARFELIGTGLAMAGMLFARTLLIPRVMRQNVKVVLPKAAMHWARLFRVLPWAIFAREGPMDMEDKMKRATLDEASGVALDILRNLPEEAEGRVVHLRKWLVNFMVYCITMTEPAGTNAVHGGLTPGIPREDILPVVMRIQEYENPDYERFIDVLEEHLRSQEGDFMMRDGAMHAKFIRIILDMEPFDAGFILSKVLTVLVHDAVRPRARAPRVNAPYSNHEVAFEGTFNEMIAEAVRQCEKTVMSGRFTEQPFRIPKTPLDAEIIYGRQVKLSGAGIYDNPMNGGTALNTVFSSHHADIMWVNYNHMFHPRLRGILMPDEE